MWRRSSYSVDGNCVEVRADLDAVRDSKDPGGPKLPAPALREFLRHVKAQRFDR